MKNLYGTNTMKVAAVFSVCFCFLFVQANAQVSISPTSLFFDSQNRFSTLIVSNGGDQPQEISINLGFSFPTYENGNIVISEDSVLAKQKSIAPYIKVFPKNFTLQSQQRQLVRFVLQPPQNIAPGGHWARVAITSNPVSQPIEESIGENQVGTQINIILNQVISAHYRTQNAQTTVDVGSVDFHRSEQGNVDAIALSMEQTGNAPFVGSISLQVKNSEGKTVYQTNATTSVYTSITRTFPINTSEWEPGTYAITATITSERRDISVENLLQIQPVTFKKQFTLE